MRGWELGDSPQLHPPTPPTPLSLLPQLSPGGIHYQVEAMMVMEKNECIASVVLYDQCRQVSHDGQLDSDQLK